MTATFGFDKYSITLVKDHVYELSKEIPEITVEEFLGYYALDMYYTLHFLSLFFKTKIQIVERIKKGKRLVLKFVLDKDFKTFESSKFGEVFDRMLLVRKEILMTYLNSCSAYHSALMLTNSNHSVAFLLLAIAVESLSNKYYASGKYGERFRRLIIDFLPKNRRFLPSELRYVDKTLNEKEEESLFNKLLESVYGRIRSGFVHFGEGSPVASIVGDRFQLAYIKAQKDGDKFAPSFVWFKRLVEEVLVNFLSSQEAKTRNDLFSLLSERFIYKMKARRAIKKGQLVTPEDIYLQ